MNVINPSYVHETHFTCSQINSNQVIIAASAGVALIKWLRSHAQRVRAAKGHVTRSVTHLRQDMPAQAHPRLPLVLSMATSIAGTAEVSSRGTEQRVDSQPSCASTQSTQGTCTSWFGSFISSGCCLWMPTQNVSFASVISTDSSLPAVQRLK